MKHLRDVIDIKIDQIKIINPRQRDQTRFEENIDSIRRLGLKRPIVVNSRYLAEHSFYELVCGQGRIEAFQKLGFDTIPALTIDVDRETAYIMSIAENATRMTPPPIWFAQVIKGLADGGMPVKQIAVILNRSVDKIRDYLMLIQQGDKVLIEAVEQGTITSSAAFMIMREPSHELQQLLTNCVDQGVIDFTDVPAVRNLIRRRIRLQQGEGSKRPTKTTYSEMTVESLRKEIVRTLEKQENFVRKSRRYENQIVIIIEEYSRLKLDPDWLMLLQTQKLTDYPKLKGDQLKMLFHDTTKGVEA